MFLCTGNSARSIIGRGTAELLGSFSGVQRGVAGRVVHQPRNGLRAQEPAFDPPSRIVSRRRGMLEAICQESCDARTDLPDLPRGLRVLATFFRRCSPFAISALIRAAARDITARGGRRRPSARHAARVLRKCAAIVSQHSHALTCPSICRRRAGGKSPSRYRESSSSSFRQRADGRVRTVISHFR
jgi:hypothetical protein